MELSTIILILLLLIVLSISVYIIKNLLTKVEKYEDIIINQDTFILTIKDLVEEAQKKLIEHDTRGHYNADDDLGNYFKTLLQVDKKITEYIDRLVKDEKT